MQSRYRDFKWKADRIVEAILTWHNWPGFSGEYCYQCKKTANVLGTHGWICVCGAFNAQCFHHNNMPHHYPQLGPNKHVFAAVRKQLVYPSFLLSPYVWVRQRQPGDQQWQIVLKDKTGSVVEPAANGYLYHLEGSHEEASRAIQKIKSWTQHRAYTLHAVTA